MERLNRTFYPIIPINSYPRYQLEIFELARQHSSFLLKKGLTPHYLQKFSEVGFDSSSRIAINGKCAAILLVPSGLFDFPLHYCVAQLIFLFFTLAIKHLKNQLMLILIIGLKRSPWVCSSFFIPSHPNRLTQNLLVSKQANQFPSHPFFHYLYHIKFLILVSQSGMGHSYAGSKESNQPDVDGQSW